MPFLLKLGKKITFSLDIQNYNILKRSVLRVKAFLLNLFFGPFIKIELE